MKADRNETPINQLTEAVDSVPEGWVLTTLSEVCEINPPKPPKNALPLDAPVTFVPMPAVDEEKGAITAPQTRRFGEVRNGYTSFRENDVIMAKITPCMENGKAAIARGLTNSLGFGSTEFHVLRSTGAVLPEVVYNFVRRESFRGAAEAEMTGSVGQKRVPQAFLDNADFPLPPLAEQNRIVEKVEQLLARVDAACERLTRVPLILKRFRQAVLVAACLGRLTADWRDKHPIGDSARQLLAEILADKRKRLRARGTSESLEQHEPDEREIGDVPEEWAKTSFDHVTCMVTSGSRGWAKYYSEVGPKFIRAQDINTDQLRLDDIAHVLPPDNAEGRRTRVQVMILRQSRRLYGCWPLKGA